MNEKPSRPARLTSTLRVAGGKGILRIEDGFDSSVDDLWSALTEPGRLSLWLGTFDGDLRPAGTFAARFFASEWEGNGRVEVCEPPRRLLVHLTEADAPDAHAIELMLTPAARQAVLVVEERGVPLDQLAAFGAGMQIHVEDLAAHLVGEGRCDARARWGALFPSYQAKTIQGG